MSIRARRAAALAAALALCAPLAVVPTAQAAGPAGTGAGLVLAVDTTLDLVDPVPGDGICGDGDVGTCSLRAAIQEANATAGPDEVTVPAGTYELTIAGTSDDTAATGDLDVLDDLVITGADAASTIVDGAGIDRVLHTPGSPGTPGAPLTVSGLTITGGSAVGEDVLGNGVQQVSGGGIASTGPLVLDAVTVTGNHADGSAIWFGSGGGVRSRGEVTITGSTFTANTASGGDTAGGGIFLEGGGTIDATTISGNTAEDLTAGYSFTASGGGGLATGGFGASYALTDVTFDDNHVIGDESTIGGSLYATARTDVDGGTFTNSDAGNGGGIGGQIMTIDNVTVSGNTALRAGGGVASQSQIASTLRDSTVTGNHAAIGGGAATFGSTGKDGDLLVVRTTVSGNDATTAGGGIGVAHPSGKLRVNTSTISGNTSAGDGGGIAVLGAASTAELTLSTVSGNAATGEGGGAAVELDAALTLTTTTMADGTGATVGGIWVDGQLASQSSIVGGQAVGDDCGGTGVGVTQGRNLDGDGTCPFDDATDVTGDPNLAPLADNGGTTLTHVPQRPSLVFDRGGSSCGTTDQRLLDRPQNLACDIGAVEVTTAQVFSDIPMTQPFFREIWWLWANGLTNGYPDGTYGPGANVSRQALVVMLWREAGSPPPKGASPFSDVPATHVFHDAIAWGAWEGIIGGYLDGTFRPANPVSRQAFAALLWRQGGKADPTISSPFSDVGPTHPFHDAIVWAYEENLTLGYADLTFRPGLQVSRQAMAAFLARFRSGAV